MTMRSALTESGAKHFVLLLILCVGASPAAFAQTTSDQFWPEIQGYYSFSSRYRVSFEASRSTDGASYNSLEIGPTLNIFARRFVHPVLATNNQANNNFLVFGVGYRYLAGINQAAENRIELDFTPRFPLFWRIQGADRNRFDLRWIQGSPFAWRYRNRLQVQRTFRLRHFVFSPYAQGEVYYSSSVQSWNKTTFQFGADIPCRKHFGFEPYFEHDNNTGSNPAHVNAFGLTTDIYF